MWLQRPRVSPAVTFAEWPQSGRPRVSRIPRSISRPFVPVVDLDESMRAPFPIR